MQDNPMCRLLLKIVPFIKSLTAALIWRCYNRDKGSCRYTAVWNIYTIDGQIRAGAEIDEVTRQ